MSVYVSKYTGKDVDTKLDNVPGQFSGSGESEEYQINTNTNFQQNVDILGDLKVQAGFSDLYEVDATQIQANKIGIKYYRAAGSDAGIYPASFITSGLPTPTTYVVANLGSNKPNNMTSDEATMIASEATAKNIIYFDLTGYGWLNVEVLKIEIAINGNYSAYQSTSRTLNDSNDGTVKALIIYSNFLANSPADYKITVSANYPITAITQN